MHTNNDNLQLNKDEMKRRSDMSRAGIPTNSEFDKISAPGSDPPFVDGEQSWVLFSISHIGMPPVAKDPSLPGIRIYGCFDSAEAATDYAKTILIPNDPTCSVQLNKTHEWICACKNATNLANSEYVNSKTDELLSSYASQRQQNKIQFDDEIKRMQESKESHTVQETTDDVDEKHITEGEAVPSTTTDLGSKIKPLSKLCEISGQSFACVSFVQDKESSQEPEFLFKVYSCFNSIDDADRYVRNVAGEHVKDFDIDVITLLKWVFPTQKIDVMTKYRASELTNIMQYHREQPAKVNEYHKTMEDRAKAPVDDELENAPKFSYS